MAKIKISLSTEKDKKKALRAARKQLRTLGMPDDTAVGPDQPDLHADIWDLEDEKRAREQLRARQLAAAFKSGRS